MPYIKPSDREELGIRKPEAAGELNYILTCMCLEYLDNNPPGYQTMNDIVGALESCKLEFYRRVVKPYEEERIRENGDVY